MPEDTVTLTASVRSTLLTQQSLASTAAQKTQALSTGKKVSRVTDNAVAFAAAQALSGRASDLAAVNDSVGQGISTINAAMAGSSAIGDMLGQLQGIATAALSTTNADELASYAQQYNQVLGQIDSLAADSGYGGVNLLSSSSSALTVSFSTDTTDNLTVTAQDGTSSGLGLSAVAADGSGFSTTLLSQLDAAVSSNSAVQSSLGSNISALSIRAEAAQNQAAIAADGAAKLTEADLTEEAAGLLATQTRQQLARVAQSVSQDMQKSLLTLF